MAKLLEVIVTSVEEAREAQLGGADRLELVRERETGGLTPEKAVVEQVLKSVSIPVRVMLRENPTMAIADAEEMATLRTRAGGLGKLPIDGLVLGFAKDGALDLEAIQEVLAAAPGCRATMHRAFDHACDPLAAIRQLKQFPQIDRILTGGGQGAWQLRKKRLLKWQMAAAPQIKILVAFGLRLSTISELARFSTEFEFHAGRAGRAPHTTAGAVSREAVAKLKAQL